MIDAIEKCLLGSYPWLIINCPPGFTKTLLVVRYAVAYVLAKNPRARNLHLSYSGTLAANSSMEIMDVLNTDLYQALFGLQPRIDKKAKGLWEVEEGGGLKASSTGGQVTGFRAARLEDGLTGFMSLDDPNKPEDMAFKKTRDRSNMRFNRTIKSRRARPDTPVIVIAQRLGDDDFTGYALRGGTGHKWHHLTIRAYNEAEEPVYPAEYTHGIPIYYPYPVGLTWPLKVDAAERRSLMDADLATWMTQYQQQPMTIAGEIFHRDWWPYYRSYDPINSCVELDGKKRVRLLYKLIYADTAMKAKEHNDYSVFELFGYGEDNRLYLLKLLRGKWEAPELLRNFRSFCEQEDFKEGVNNMGVRSRKVEDKSSGTGLIQSINREKGYDYIEGIPRDRDKVSRAKSGAPSIKDGKVVLPYGAEWVPDYIAEFSAFSATMDHKFDDQIDPTLDAIEDNLVSSGSVNYSEVL
jgi:predicted phage terminase large subunit-like protein